MKQSMRLDMAFKGCPVIEVHRLDNTVDRYEIINTFTRTLIDRWVRGFGLYRTMGGIGYGSGDTPITIDSVSLTALHEPPAANGIDLNDMDTILHGGVKITAGVGSYRVGGFGRRLTTDPVTQPTVIREIGLFTYIQNDGTIDTDNPILIAGKVLDNEISMSPGEYAEITYSIHLPGGRFGESDSYISSNLHSVDISVDGVDHSVELHVALDERYTYANKAYSSFAIQNKDLYGHLPYPTWPQYFDLHHRSPVTMHAENPGDPGLCNVVGIQSHLNLPPQEHQWSDYPQPQSTDLGNFLDYLGLANSDVIYDVDSQWDAVNLVKTSTITITLTPDAMYPRGTGSKVFNIHRMFFDHNRDVIINDGDDTLPNPYPYYYLRFSPPLRKEPERSLTIEFNLIENYMTFDYRQPDYQSFINYRPPTVTDNYQLTAPYGYTRVIVKWDNSEPLYKDVRYRVLGDTEWIYTTLRYTESITYAQLYPSGTVFEIEFKFSNNSSESQWGVFATTYTYNY